MLNKQKGNMYGFVTDTWNTVKGKCPHNCSYCYMKEYKQKELHFDEKELKTDLGMGKFIFVGSSCDMFANTINRNWIYRTLEICDKYDNKYLFQSKNPNRFIEFLGDFPKNLVLGTTIETNRRYMEMGVAPWTSHRAASMYAFKRYKKIERMVTIEPIIDFDLKELIKYIKLCNPTWVNIGADSKGHKLPEPKYEKVAELIGELKGFTEVKIKPNLRRLNK